jgi:hypothetical protein
VLRGVSPPRLNPAPAATVLTGWLAMTSVGTLLRHLLSVPLALALVQLPLGLGEAAAAPTRSASAGRAVAAPSRGGASPRRAATPGRATRKRPAAPPAAKAAPPSLPEASAPQAPEARPAPNANEAKVVAPAAAPAATAVVKTEEAEQGVKTYTFGAEEVEGRLKSPQILYFLRRVRAEFDAEPLGHRSFLLELSDTRRHPSL